MTTVSVVIPVKDGSRYLQALLDAVQREGVDEVLVIDSGSVDDSAKIARAAGASVIAIEPEQFGHGRTRNLGAEQTTGDLICFLTQDATPVEGWLAAYREAFSLAPNVGAAYGPHLARPDTSPMIARELAEFFAGFSENGGPVVQQAGDPPFLSNVNACYDRRCWQEIRFRDVAYAEDQAFGADLLAAGWTKVYHPLAAVQHAHDYGAVAFMRRYFDEYRGLRETTGHVERFEIRGVLRRVAGSVAADRRWMGERDIGQLEQARWAARGAVHHAGRGVFSALGSRSDRIPGPIVRAVSLETRAADRTAPPTDPRHPASTGPPASTLAGAVHVGPMRAEWPYAAAVDVQRHGAVPLLEPQPGMAERQRLRLAMVIPPFSRGSGGHNTLFQIFSRLERRGHVCSAWLHDPWGDMRSLWPAVLRSGVREYFAPFNGPVYKEFADWGGADVVIATGWQTVHPALRLDRTYSRVYLVNDHEPEFYATSSERLLAEDTYRHGLHCVAASPWLRDLLIGRYGATADAFQLGVDHDIYRPQPVPRRADTVIFYCRSETPRRAVAFGVSALGELHRRRPDIRIVLFGSSLNVETTFPHLHLGVLSRGSAVAAVLRGHGRAVPVVDELLADPEGDARLRSAVRRAGRGERRIDLRRERSARAGRAQSVQCR